MGSAPCVGDGRHEAVGIPRIEEVGPKVAGGQSDRAGLSLQAHRDEGDRWHAEGDDGNNSLLQAETATRLQGAAAGFDKCCFVGLPVPVTSFISHTLLHVAQCPELSEF